MHTQHGKFDFEEMADKAKSKSKSRTNSNVERHEGEYTTLAPEPGDPPVRLEAQHKIWNYSLRITRQNYVLRLHFS